MGGAASTATVGPWYEEEGPNTQKVKEMLGEKLDTDQHTRKIIDEVVDGRNTDKWGSYRGFYKFMLGSLVTECKKKLIEYGRR